MKRIFFLTLFFIFFPPIISFGREPISDKERPEIAGHIYLELEAPKSRIFVSEKVPVKVRLYSDWLDLENISLRQQPSEQLIVRKFGDKTVTTIDKGGTKFVVLEYPSSFFAVMPGQYELKPVEAKMDVLMPKETGGQTAELLNDNREFYERFISMGRNRPLELKTHPLDVTVLPLPTAGRPEDFGGAVGEFNFDLKAEPGRVKIGDTLTITMSITGDGNYDTVTMPQISDIKGARLLEPRTTKGKDFITHEQIVKIESGDFNEVPAVTFSFFNPNTAGYVSTQRGPVPITLEGYIKKPETLGGKGEKLKQEAVIVQLKGSTEVLRKYDMRFYKRPLFLTLGIIPVIAMILASGLRRRMDFLEKNPQYAAMLRASKKARKRIVKAKELLKKKETKGFYDAVFNVLQGYLGERAHLPEEGITEKVIHQFSIRDMDEDVPAKIKKIFADCYMAKFTSSDFSEDEMKETLEILEYAVGYLDKKEFNT